jgi:hypothetical protein
MSNPNPRELPLPQPPLTTLTTGGLEDIRQALLAAYYSYDLLKAQAETIYGLAIAIGALSMSQIALAALHQYVIDEGQYEYLIGQS